MQGFTKLAMLTLKLIQKWGSCCVFDDVLNPRMRLTFSQNLSNKGLKKQWKRTNNNNKEMSNLGPSFTTLVLRITLNFCFWSGPIDFPFKMVPFKLNHNLICLCPGVLSKYLWTNLKLLTNKNTQFHWTLLLGGLYKVALKYKMPKLRI